jgi:drug/metabolite transporter (DMT)-like permease
MVYTAISFTSPSNVTTLVHTSIILTAIFSRFMFDEKISISIFVSIILSCLGVVFISKPTFLFPIDNDQYTKNKNHSYITNLIDHSKLEINEQISTLVGTCLSLIAAMFTTVIFLVLKKLCNSKIHWSTSSIVSSFYGIPLTAVTSLGLYMTNMSHQDFEKEKQDLPYDLFYSLLSSMGSLFAQIAMNKALMYEDPTKIR